MDLLSKALFGATLLFLLLNPINSSSQTVDCEPLISLEANLQANSGAQPANEAIVSTGMSFIAPAEATSAAGIKVFFTFIRGGATLSLTLHEGAVGDGSQDQSPAIATATYTNPSANNLPLTGNTSAPACFEFDSPVSLTPGAVYYYLVPTGCDNDVSGSCLYGTQTQFDNPYADGRYVQGFRQFDTDRVSGFRSTWDSKFIVYAGGCDDVAPIAVANNITVNVGTNQGTYNLRQTDVDAIATGTSDNCPNFLTYEITDGPTSFSCNDDGRAFRVTLTAKDACDNTATESAFVTINCKDPSPLTLESGNRLNFSDPCSCDDPLNCDIMGVTYFHDTLVVTAAGVTGLSITTVAGATDFFTDVPCSGGVLTPVPTGTLIPETPIGSGIYKLEFWRPSGAVPTLSVEEVGTVTAVPMATFDPACAQEDCNPIPTMSQWALVILAMLMASIGLVFMKKRKSSWA